MRYFCPGPLGIVYYSQGRYEEAADAYRQDLEICREFKDRVGEGQTLRNLALLWEKRGDKARATSFARQAVTVLEDTEAKVDLANARATLAGLEGGG